MTPGFTIPPEIEQQEIANHQKQDITLIRVVCTGTGKFKHPKPLKFTVTTNCFGSKLFQTKKYSTNDGY